MGSLMHDISDPIVISNLYSLIASRGAGGMSFAHHQFLRELPDAFCVDRVGLYLFDNGYSPCDVFTSFAGRSTDLFVREYEQLRSKDPVFRYLRKHNGAMDGSTLLGREGWKCNGLYQWLHKWRLGYTLQGAITFEGRLLATLNLARAHGKDEFGGDEINAVQQLCQELASRLAASEEASKKYASFFCRPTESVKEEIPADALHALAHCDAVVVTNEAGEVAPVSSGDAHGLALYERYTDMIRLNIQSLKTATRSVAQLPVYSNGSGQLCALLVTNVLPGEEGRYLSSLIAVPNAGEISPKVEDLDELPPRTQTVAELLLKGYSNKLIAKELLVSENTIKDHVKRIFDFYGINSRSQLANLSGILALSPLSSAKRR